uniref:SMODS and SLOG-associating 2TM effector domain-containing protein n=1 Tax=Candidatus Kentrum sp. FM TaxID=2126340 RepID=A0A450S1S4_9GAMM|nr:MAG: hypothetical protein BECKFM1743A_GA0114220_100277 [Candidatus Kentron sp. FM]VFJ49448.1 MAG: hypothetical protein BECKFM1743C_GA0114222_100717 [Candidatus Kentron sp. FM]VFK20007.1 MAG: hypothetical protein BECKFM1743B_GA0114221_106622 [Candidatus Kentron sp. FM]
MSDGIRKAIWESMLTADMNARYWKSLVHRYVRRDKGLKIFLALTTSGSAVGAWDIWDKIPYLWQILSSVSVVVAISLPFLDYQKRIEQLSALAGEWGTLRIECEDLWREIKNHPNPQLLEERHRMVRETEAILQGKEINLPDDKTLLKRCFDEVKQARGL